MEDGGRRRVEVEGGGWRAEGARRAVYVQGVYAREGWVLDSRK